MKTIKELEHELLEQDTLVREKIVKVLLVVIGDKITKRHGWVKRREEEIAELTALDVKMRKAYLDSDDDILDAVEIEVAEFDEKNKGRSRRDFRRN